MTLALVWTDEATTDLLDILDYIAARDRDASTASMRESSTPPSAFPTTR